MKYWTDYPFTELGDEPHQEAPIRQVELISYDDDRYVTIKFEEKYLTVKSGYIYMKPGRCGQVPPITRRILYKLPITLR